MSVPEVPAKKKCPNCGADVEWTRVKDILLYFDSTTHTVTIEAEACSSQRCGWLSVWES